MTNVRGQRVAYLRVSTVDQSEARQREAVGECDRIFLEKQSARSRAGRPQLEACLQYVRDGDELVVASMDRLARSLIDLQSIVEELNAKGVTVRFLKEGQDYAPSYRDPRAKLMMALLGGFAEFERDIIRERQAEGIALAKAAGRYKGRAKALKPADMEEVAKRLAAGTPKTKIAADLSVDRSTLYRALERARQWIPNAERNEEAMWATDYSNLPFNIPAPECLFAGHVTISRGKDHPKPITYPIEVYRTYASEVYAIVAATPVGSPKIDAEEIDRTIREKWPALDHIIEYWTSGLGLENVGHFEWGYTDGKDGEVDLEDLLELGLPLAEPTTLSPEK